MQTYTVDIAGEPVTLPLPDKGSRACAPRLETCATPKAGLGAL